MPIRTIYNEAMAEIIEGLTYDAFIALMGRAKPSLTEPRAPCTFSRDIRYPVLRLPHPSAYCGRVEIRYFTLSLRSTQIFAQGTCIVLDGRPPLLRHDDGPLYLSPSEYLIIYLPVDFSGTPREIEK
jgi:hypothetical protein